MSGRAVQNAAVATHYNQRQDVGRGAREASPIVHLKKLNNWIKVSRRARLVCCCWSRRCGVGGALKNAAREATEQRKRALRCEAEGNTTLYVLHRHATQLLTRPYSRQPPFDTICLT